jgi:hypothetical protein
LRAREETFHSRGVRALGVLVAVLAAAAATQCVRGAFTARRPRDLAFALAAPILILVAIAGVVIAFAPESA